MKKAPSAIAVIGAGITGLTAAYRIAQRGHRVRLFEASARVGGAIRTEVSGGWLIEAGPNSLQTGNSEVTALLGELGLAQQCIAANPKARNRYIVRRGQPVAVPLSPPALIRSELFSAGAKFRILSEMFRRRSPRASDVSLEELIRSHFGQEVVDYGLNPLVTGVYAGDPGKLSARHAFPTWWETEQKHGSFLRAQIAAGKRRGQEPRPGILSFPGGLQTLPEALASKLPPETLVLHAKIEALVPGAPWNVIWNDGASTQTEAFDAVVAALPAPALAQLRFGPLGERTLSALDAIEHPPVSSLFLGYRREQIRHALDGFGLLVPAAEKESMLGILFSSSLFPGRAPAGHAALTVIMGGTRSPAMARLSPDRARAAVEPDLQRLLGIAGAPVFERHTFWPRAIPQYNLGYERHLELMAAAERAHPGLFIGGQARDGIALGRCIAGGEKLAARIA